MNVSVGYGGTNGNTYRQPLNLSDVQVKHYINRRDNNFLRVDVIDDHGVTLGLYGTHAELETVAHEILTRVAKSKLPRVSGS